MNYTEMTPNEKVAWLKIFIDSDKFFSIDDVDGEHLSKCLNLLADDLKRNGLSLTELQKQLPWTVKYSGDFRANPQSHKDFAHALLHVTKASGKIASLIDDYDHRRESEMPHIKLEGYIADLVICALRMANTFPGSSIDLQTAVECRLELKNDIQLKR